MNPEIPNPEKFIGELPDFKIKEYVESGRIVLVPKPKPEEWKDLLGPVSLDFRLGPIIRYLDTQNLTHIDPSDPDLENKWKTHDMRTTQGFYMLHPNHFVQAETLEWLEIPADIVGHINGKSSLGRYGLLVHATAPRFDPGWQGRIVLELRNVGELPFRLDIGRRIAAMEFVEMMLPSQNPYQSREGSKYKQQDGAVGSRSYLEDQPRSS